jgi:phenylpropionate dioxygenase-like ring-hydroxylating dioxygenase large terminal subunit
MNLLDPHAYLGVRRPLREAETLPPACYTSREFYEAEVRHIFMKCWNIVGREDFAKAPGDYFTFSLVGTPAFVIRGRDGRLRAFINSCRHRGARLLENDGKCRAITCPYHAWGYDLEGNLFAPTGMDETSNFNPADFHLLEIKLETWCGFVFVNFDASAESLRSYLGNLDDYTESYGLETMVTTRRRSFPVHANWKNYVENSQEVFHLPTIHRNTFGTLKAEFTHVNGAPSNFTIQGTRLTVPKPRSVLDGAAGFERISTLRGPAAVGAQVILIYPCTILVCDLDYMWFRQMEPEGPDVIHYKAAFCFPKPTAERPDFESIAQNYYKRADAVIAEDNLASEIQFAGLNQPFGKPGRFSAREPLVHAIDNWILDRVFGPATGVQREAAE